MAAHKKVQCWIFANDAGNSKCLLLKTNAQRGNFWQPVTGSVEKGEDFFEAACREPYEETGLEFDSPPKETQHEFEYQSKHGLTKEKTFTMVIRKSREPRLDPKEHEDFKWVTPKEALLMLKFPSNADGLRVSYKLLFGEDL